ncbi:hypothetical protein AYO22_10576 [Fonsecaea multimorphosa]|nr:hypothetical protein AYO22_10576 [Fonsecaea multimorphosa]
MTRTSRTESWSGWTKAGLKTTLMIALNVSGTVTDCWKRIVYIPPFRSRTALTHCTFPRALLELIRFSSDRHTHRQVCQPSHDGPAPGTHSFREGALLDSAQSDLFSVTECPRTPLRNILEDLGLFLYIPFFHRRDIKPGSNIAGCATFYDDDKIELFINYTICLLGFIMLAAPLWILFCLSDYRKVQLAVTTAFILLLTLALTAASVRSPSHLAMFDSLRGF